MAESIIQVNSGTGPKVHTNQRTIGANNVEDTVSIQGEHYLATYSVAPTSTISVATSTDHLLQIMAGASLNVRIKRIVITQAAAATTATNAQIQIVRLTTAGTGGTSQTPAKYDNGDAAAGATAMTLPTAKGTEGTFLYAAAMSYVSALPNAREWRWEEHPGMKPIIIPAGTANGIAIRNGAAVAAGSVVVAVEFTETSFL